MKNLIAPVLAAMACAAVTLPAQAEDSKIAAEKLVVLSCLEQIELTTTWPQCLNLMFQPCVTHEVGSDAHVACLGDIRKEWTGTVETLQADLTDALSGSGQTELLNIMGLWSGYVTQKCQEVATSKPANPESARLGCEITEIAGLSGEFVACLEGRSTAEYCVIKE